MDYKSAGVDIQKGEDLVDWLKADKSPSRYYDQIVGGIGGFASIFQCNFSQMQEPCLVSATDGIGTKLKLAIEMEKYDTLGQDLVAMCANDLICTGAQPLFFLDYFATSHLDLEQAQPFLAGVRKACYEAHMALLGGETAEMPGLYQPKDFDCAGFAVGVVDRPQILKPENLKPGFQAIGVSSTGFHSNGYSLVRKLFSSPEDIKDWGERLLTPTALYVDLAMKLMAQKSIAALAHITGGGIHNVARVLPEGLGLELKAWDFPEIFKEAQKRGELSTAEMLKTFNCGVGLVILTSKDQVESVQTEIQSQGFESYDLGSLVESSESLIFPEPWS
jgi:phosphoribosylformylglycinamidine cyclo-ligase